MARLTIRGPKGNSPKTVRFADDPISAASPAAEHSPVTASDIEPAKKNIQKTKKMSTAVPPAPTGDDGDTIAVQQKPKTVEIEDDSDDESPLSDLEQLGKIVEANLRRSPLSKANRPWARNGKAPARGILRNNSLQQDSTMIDADEEDVDEGSIDYNDQGEDDSSVADDEDKASVISISSQEDSARTSVRNKEEDPPSGMPARPWRIEGFNRGMREHWETMYCAVEMRALDHSWEKTEDYQHEKDKEMLRYMEDFPLPTWVIPKEQAEHAYFRMLERTRWRTLGIRIFGQQRIPEIIPNATPFNRVGPMPQQQMHPDQYPHQPQHGQQRQLSMGGSRPPSVPQQQMQYHPPPYGMPPNGLPPNGMHPPPPTQMLRSQPHAMPMNVPPGQHPHQQAMEYLHRQHSMGGHPHMSHAPHGLPYAVPPHMMSHANVPMHAPRPIPQGMPPGMSKIPVGLPNPKPSRRKKSTPPPATPPPPPPTPPYDAHPRPVPRKEFNKTGKRNMRKQAEALDFPWQRKMDFYKARAEATWDDSGYDKDILDAMTAVRQKNMPIISKLDDELSEKQKSQRNAKKRGQQIPDGHSSDMEKTKPEDGRKKETKRKSENIGGDPYYSGNFSFASEEDRQRALALQRKTPDDIIDDAEAGRIDWELCKEIFICWNPGKKGLTQDLVQAQYRIYDTLITRKQLESTPILTRRAAECIVDFCPDLLWRETLLRIVSEAGYGNKDVRDRFCYNGCHNDKATITKRIAAALGQKQQNVKSRKAQLEDAEAEAAPSDAADEESQPAPKKGRRGQAKKEKADDKEEKARYQKGEQEWHDANKIDFNNYIRFFGKRPASRIYPTAGEKRKKSEEADGCGGHGSEMDVGTPRKRAKSEVQDGPSPATSDGVEMEVDDANVPDQSEAEESEEEEVEEEVEEEGGDEAEDGDDENAVSVQGDSILGDSD